MQLKRIPILLGEDTQKAQKAKEDLAQEGTARRWHLTDHFHSIKPCCG